MGDVATVGGLDSVIRPKGVEERVRDESDS